MEFNFVDEVIPFGILFVGLDPKFKHFGFNADKFLDFFEEGGLRGTGCNLLRKGVSLHTQERNAK